MLIIPYKLHGERWLLAISREKEPIENYQYATGLLPPNYPLPAINYKVKFVYVSPGDPFNGVTIRDNLGWLVAGLAEDGTPLGAPRAKGQCSTCGSFRDCDVDCPFFD